MLEDSQPLRDLSNLTLLVLIGHGRCRIYEDASHCR